MGFSTNQKTLLGYPYFTIQWLRGSDLERLGYSHSLEIFPIPWAFNGEPFGATNRVSQPSDSLGNLHLPWYDHEKNASEVRYQGSDLQADLALSDGLEVPPDGFEGCWERLGIHPEGLSMDFPLGIVSNAPSYNTAIAAMTMKIHSGFTHEKWQFCKLSIVILVCQRVICVSSMVPCLKESSFNRHIWITLTWFG